MNNNNMLLDIASGFVIFVCSVAGIIIVKNNKIDPMGQAYGPEFFPSLVLWLMIILSLVLFMKSVYTFYKQREAGIDSSVFSFNKIIAFKLIIFIALTVSYAFAFTGIGFFVSTMILLFFIQYLYGNRNLLRVSLMAIFLPVILYLVFNGLFKIPLATVFS